VLEAWASLCVGQRTTAIIAAPVQGKTTLLNLIPRSSKCTRA